MKESLMKFLCCPDCKSNFDLTVTNQINKEIMAGKLTCPSCNKDYFIKKGIPVILEGKKLRDFTKTQSNWENWWNKIREKSDIELYNKLWVAAEKKLGVEPLYLKKDFQNKIVLDAGCGNGRHIKSDFSKFNCKEIIAVDLGKQVYLARKNNKNLTNVHYIQTDLTNLPLKVECVDIIASHGVLHHTPNPKKTFTSLSKHLKKDGMFALYVYHKEWAHFTAHKKSLLLDATYANGVLIWQTIRKITSRMPHAVLMLFCYCMAAKSTIEQGLQDRKITRRFGKLLQLIPPFAYIGINFHERLVRNYDHYSATFNYFSTTEEVIDWFSSNNFNDLVITSVPISMKGYKKAKKEHLLRINQHNPINHFRFREEWKKVYKK